MNSETERLEMLDALKQARRRYLAVLETCASLVERQANQGDPLAKHVIGELAKAEISLKAENIACHAFVDEAQGSVS
jgi:hypothetical protein